MFNQFSNEATAVVFERIANDPDAFEEFACLVRREPAKAPEEIRSFVEERVHKSVKDPFARDLADTALRNVRWTELREAIKLRA